jgi:hypothetical protein
MIGDVGRPTVFRRFHASGIATTRVRVALPRRICRAGCEAVAATVLASHRVGFSVDCGIFRSKGPTRRRTPRAETTQMEKMQKEKKIGEIETDAPGRLGHVGKWF